MPFQKAIASRQARTTLGILAVLLIIFFSRQYSYLLFHTLVELLGIAVAWAIFMITWNTRDFSDNRFLQILGIGYLAVSILELLHTLGYSGSGILPGFNTNFPTQLWIAARFTETLTLLLALFRPTIQVSAEFLLFGFMLLVAALLVLILNGLFPDCWRDGSGLTPFKIISEYLIVTAAIAALVLLIRNRSFFDPGILPLLIAALAATILSEIFFTLYSSVVDLYNEIGHYLKVLSYYFIYQTIIENGLRNPYVLLFHDLERNRDELRNSEERFRLQLNNLPNAIHVWEKKEDDFILAYCNGVARLKENPDVFSTIGVSLSDFTNVRPDLQNSIHRCFDDGKNSRMETSYLMEDTGEVRHLIVSFTRIPPDMVMVTTVDITEQKKSEEQLRQAKLEAEKADRLKSAFLANVSHEIRTPLNAILGFTDLLLDENTNDRQTKFLRTISDSGELLLRLLDDILDISKIEAGQLEITNLPFSLYAVIESALDGGRGLIKKLGKNIELRASTVEQISSWIMGDRLRLQQVLNNLMGNAVKFTEAGSIEFGLNLTSENGREELKFHVTDTGKGIPTDKMEVIFEPFRQSDMSDTRRYGGSGLGLAISRRLVELMNGRIYVESRTGENHGSTFYVTIPYEPVDAQDATPSGSGIQIFAMNQCGRVLLVEDNPDSSELMVILLEKMGYQVTVAENGQEAVSEFHHFPDFDIILMDLQMPVMDGLQATREIRKMEKEQNFPLRHPIIAITASAMVGDRERALEAGCDDYIAKPIDQSRLALLVETYRKVPEERS